MKEYYQKSSETFFQKSFLILFFKTQSFLMAAIMKNSYYNFWVTKYVVELSFFSDLCSTLIEIYFWVDQNVRTDNIFKSFLGNIII